jgi:hypothetical protein
MKISTLILATALAATTMDSAAAATTTGKHFHLRASKPQDQAEDQVDAYNTYNSSLDKKKHKDDPKPSGNFGFMGATISVTHVSADKTNFDEEKVSQAFIQAYNKVHKNGYSITTGFIDKEILIPETADSGNNNQDEAATLQLQQDDRRFFSVLYYYQFGYATKTLDATSRPGPADDSSVRGEFESHFLETLRSSDMAAFADIQQVHIVFTYTDPTTTADKDEFELDEQSVPRIEKRNPKPSDDNTSMHGQIEVTHIMGGGNSGMINDMEILGIAYKEAFDAAYSFMGYRVTSFNMEREIDIPEASVTTDGDGNPDNLQANIFLTGLYYYAFGYGCRWCGNDDDLLGGSEALMAGQDSGAQRFFEKLFCHKLKRSSLLRFTVITHCSIDFDAASDVDVSFVDSVGVSSQQ